MEESDIFFFVQFAGQQLRAPKLGKPLTMETMAKLWNSRPGFLGGPQSLSKQVTKEEMDAAERERRKTKVCPGSVKSLFVFTW